MMIIALPIKLIYMLKIHWKQNINIYEKTGIKSLENLKTRTEYSKKYIYVYIYVHGNHKNFRPIHFSSYGNLKVILEGTF